MSAPKDRLEAELSIYQLCQRYAHAVDIHGGAAQAACFTDDGWFAVSSGARSTKAEMAARAMPADVKRRHFFTQPVIDFTSADTATGEGFCQILEWYPATGEKKPPFSVDYHDEYRREGAGWLLVSRRITMSFG